MSVRSMAAAVEVAVDAAVAGTPWERDPTVRARGANGADSLPAEAVGLVWCGSYDAVRRRYPYLPQSHGNQPGGCVDLWVHLDVDGLLSEVDFEGQSLSDTFRRMQGSTEAEEVDGLLGLPADVVAPRLARHLVDLLQDGATAGG